MKMSVREARAQFAAAVASAERGEPVIITRNGRPVAQITLPPVTEIATETPEAFWARLARVREELGLDKTAPDPRSADEWLQDFNDPAWTRELFGPDYFDDERIEDSL